MLLRRITEHVKAQNWFAVFLDFVIVVVGVFIGIQVSNWNDARGDRARETQILREIASDLESDLVVLPGSLDNTLDRIAAGLYLLEQAPDGALSMLPEDGTLVGYGYDDAIASSAQLAERGFGERAETLKSDLWSSVLRISNAQPSTTAFDSLVSAGEIGILRNKDLVSNVQQYRAFAAGIENVQDATFRPSRDNAVDIGQSYGLSAFGGVDENVLIDLVADQPRLAATVQTQLGHAQAHFAFLTILNETAITLYDQINDELDGELEEVE